MLACCVNRWFHAIMKDKGDHVRKTYRALTARPPPAGQLVHFMLGQSGGLLVEMI
jgi:hypothetical protein